MNNSEKMFRSALEKAYAKYGSRPYVNGIDIGCAHENGIPVKGMRAVRIHVQEKIDDRFLEDRERLPTELDGIRVDVLQASYKPTSAMDTSETLPRNGFYETIQPGLSVGHIYARTGTIGLIVFDLATGHPCLLSNWHVLAGNFEAQANDPIVQPGSLDGGLHADHTVAGLHRAIIDRHGDAAIAALLSTREFALELFGTQDRIVSVRDPYEEEVLVKSGRTTGVTRAVVDGIGYYQIPYHEVNETISMWGFRLRPDVPSNPGNEEISYEGDSGSVWYNTDELAGVGLHVAGEVNAHPAKEHAIACCLTLVLKDLAVSIDPVTEEWAKFSTVEEIDLLRT